MKTLEKIKLNQLSKHELKKREMTVLKGGKCGNCYQYCTNSTGSDLAEMKVEEY